jgi:YidC/Oxa1 family membrane protein insertase
LQLLDLGKHLQGPLSQLVSSILNTSLASFIPLNDRFLWLNLGQADPLYVLPIVVVITTYWQQKMMTPPSADSQSQAMNRQMAIMMPLMFGYFVMISPSGLGLYWLISNVIGIVQYWLVGRPQTAPAAATPGAASKAITPPPKAVTPTKRKKSAAKN